MWSRPYTPRTTCLIGIASLAAACGDAPVGVPDGSLDAVDAAFLASQISGLGVAAVDEETAQLAAAPAGLQAAVAAGPGFLRARQCPAGGQLEIDGEISFSFDGETLSVSFEAVKTMDDCAFERREDLFIVNGSVEISGSRTKVAGEPSGLQETHIGGAVTIFVQSTGEEQTCEIDITSVADPEAGTREVTGTFCGHEVGQNDRTRG
jgi:hypothetical protein